MNLSESEITRIKQKYGPWAVVTGATSGIGLDVAIRLAQCGVNLIINARNAEQLAKVKQQLSITYNIQVITIAADLATEKGVKDVMQQTENIPVGLFVAAAGFGTSGLFLDNSIVDEVDMLRVNCEAVVILSQYFGRRFAIQNKGGIILFSSLVAFQGVPYAANYAATKAYIQTFAEGLREELIPFGVDVLAVAPGPVNTGFGARANMKMSNALAADQIGVPVLKALGRKGTVIPGFLSKFLIYSLATLPRWGKVKAMKAVMGGMTKHQRG